jgi:hypothetical protein
MPMLVTLVPKTMVQMAGLSMDLLRTTLQCPTMREPMPRKVRLRVT